MSVSDLRISAPGTDTVLSVRDLKVWYGTPRGAVRAVDGVSFDLRRGETLGLVGESGCGKSTLGRGVLGLLPTAAKTAGSVVFEGQELVGASIRDLRRLRGPSLGLIFQEPMTRLNPLLRISEHFDETLRTHETSLSKAQRRRRSLDALGSVGIPPTRFDNYPHEFSGGMRQRIMIALVLVLNPAMVVADEPTTALDVLVEAQILRILADIKSELRHGDPADHAQPRHRRRGLRPGRRDVRGQDRRAGRCGRGLPGPAAPVHRGAAALDDLALDHRAALDPRRTTRSRRPAARLPVPPALPAAP